MTEPSVTITDYILALEAAVFAVLIYRMGDPAAELRAPFAVFFASTAVAAAAGGTVHGFFSGADSGAGRALWRLTLLAIGLTALAAWVIGSRLLLAPDPAALVQRAAALVAVAYAIVVLAVDDRFFVAIAHYLPPAFFLLVAFVAGSGERNVAAAGCGASGMLLTFAAAIVQQRKLALHPAYFDHNALYHAVQAVALALIFSAAVLLT